MGTVVVLVAENIYELQTSTVFYPLGKSESVNYTVCIHKSTLHSDCSSK